MPKTQLFANRFALRSWPVLGLCALATATLGCNAILGNPDPAGVPGGSGGAGTGGQASGGTASGTGGGASQGNGAVTELSLRTLDKVDVLFVVDNSVSMANKQTLLVQAVPTLIEGLLVPDCLDPNGNRSPSSGGVCPDGSSAEFDPVSDIHIGVISSSLGAFGAEGVCADADDADKSRLIPYVRDGAPNPSGLGFLEWSGAEQGTVEALSATLQQQIQAVGETGCGFEAPLEAWYRFLVDPSPPAALELGTDNITRSTEVDQGILAQRAEFLRPDSFVAIVVLTDENDCSAMEGGGHYANAGFGWLVANTERTFETASAACANNPNDPCCYSCLQKTPPAGCTDTCTRDANGNGAKLRRDEDRMNLRCFQNKRRFGLDLLYPVSRYVDGLTQRVIVDTQATTGPSSPVTAQNPLLSSRPPGQVFLAGIVGVPWQDIATTATLNDPNALEYLDARRLRQPDDALGGRDRWALILGQPNLPASSPECQSADPPAACGAAPVPPLDPFLIESIAPRSGTHPITGDAIIPVGAAGWSPINGSEYENGVDVGDGPANDDLQYSCIFPLAATAVKADCAVDDASCDCGAEPNKGSPLCKPAGSSASTAATTTQSWAKAYPAPRVLQVLRDFGENSVVGSICPKIQDDTSSPAFGYRPALTAVVRRLAGVTGTICLSPSVSESPGSDGAGCTIVEATPLPSDCSREGRAAVAQDILSTAREFLEKEGHCSGDSGAPCDDFGLCAILPVEDPAPCAGTTPAVSQAAGYCVVDAAAAGPGCGSEGRMLRFVGPNTPTQGAIVLRVCEPEEP